jgi:5-methylcytosine-specific restriction endonuclease McrBC regulatory subunit McrC
MFERALAIDTRDFRSDHPDSRTIREHLALVRQKMARGTSRDEARR